LLLSSYILRKVIRILRLMVSPRLAPADKVADKAQEARYGCESDKQYQDFDHL
jgi:hypothetical protein